MNEKDDIILEYLRDTGVAEPPKVLHFNLIREGADHSIDTTRRRLKRLEKSGLVQIVKEKGAYYEITDAGVAYLAGDLDVDKLED